MKKSLIAMLVLLIFGQFFSIYPVLADETPSFRVVIHSQEVDSWYLGAIKFAVENELSAQGFPENLHYSTHNMLIIITQFSNQRVENDSDFRLGVYGNRVNKRGYQINFVAQIKIYDQYGKVVFPTSPNHKQYFTVNEFVGESYTRTDIGPISFSSGKVAGQRIHFACFAKDVVNNIKDLQFSTASPEKYEKEMVLFFGPREGVIKPGEIRTGVTKEGHEVARFRVIYPVDSKNPDYPSFMCGIFYADPRFYEEGVYTTIKKE